MAYMEYMAYTGGSGQRIAGQRRVTLRPGNRPNVFE